MKTDKNVWTLSESLPTAEEYNSLRVKVGWGTDAAEVINQNLPNSLYCVCAKMNGTCIGMSRVIGDGGLVFYIQDVVVIPEYQKQGIGTQLMSAVMRFIRSHANHNTIIGLMAAPGIEPFYQRFGFITRADENEGAGMTLVWQDKA